MGMKLVGQFKQQGKISPGDLMIRGALNFNADKARFGL